MEAAAAAATRAVEKKKRPTTDPNQYELRCLKNGPWIEAQVEFEAARVKVKTAPVVRGSIPIGIPLTGASGESL